MKKGKESRVSSVFKKEKKITPTTIYSGSKPTMCLINLHFHDHPNYKLIVAANRDEFYNRPTSLAFLGRRTQSVSRTRFSANGHMVRHNKRRSLAALTNYRDPAQFGVVKASRGEIVKNFLVEDTSPLDFINELNKKKEHYNGFNIIIGNAEQLHYYNNINGQIIEITPGTHSLSNHFLNTPLA